MTEDDVRRLVAELPGTEERSHHGHPDFRVGGRIFATLWPGDDRGVLMLPHAEVLDLAERSPDVFSVASARQPIGALSVRLSAIDTAAYAELLEAAWAVRAPQRLIDERRGTDVSG
jgi:hypothetical protein